MANTEPDEPRIFNLKVIDEFRANEGRVGGVLEGATMILIHHIGAKSGIERVTPLACSPQEDGSLVIVAANGGSPTHPDWCHNLRANPRVGVEIGTETLTMLAEELDATARADLWPKLIASAPAVGEFQAMTTRQIPVFTLTRGD